MNALARAETLSVLAASVTDAALSQRDSGKEPT
ncbi:hypothetical protein J2W54_004637 [Rhodococcus fascians]|uniref:Uncharacterized protein n=2 Tax=root TaxID=1 RepID=A0A143QS24_RHOFA|nr:hypothetical protein A3Q41_04691 [Rhodococcus fascians]AMY54860.1 hypothetical protein A3L23_03535 [Rhodococcus fascians D188]KJV02591.1 hypothetical protein VF34_02090 [Rhodococcus sp. PML026]MDP9639098.1 hypothetical protein [Rhodococcus cercidiphylli]MDR6912708.1 hypothetical protein [Rhodococcus sp. 3258]